MFHTGIIHLPDNCCTCSLSVSDCGCTMGPHLLDDFGSLGFVLAEGSFRVQYLLSVMGVWMPWLEVVAQWPSSSPLGLGVLCWRGAQVCPKMSLGL